MAHSCSLLHSSLPILTAQLSQGQPVSFPSVIHMPSQGLSKGTGHGGRWAQRDKRHNSSSRILLRHRTHTQKVPGCITQTKKTRRERKQGKPGKEGLLEKAMQERWVRALEARGTGWAKVKLTQSLLRNMPQTCPRNFHNPWSAEFLNFGLNG